MKTFLGFLSGVIVSGLLMVGVQFAMPTRAQTVDATGNSTENATLSLVRLLPDFDKIYREALLLPFHEAEKTIYDEDIARFYHTLLERSSLTYPSDKVN